MKKIILMALAATSLTSCMSAGQWHARKGMALYGKQKYKKAAKQLEAAVKSGYTEPGLRYALGSSYLYTGMNSEAVRELEAASLESAEAWFKLGNAYYNLDDYAKAAEAYRKAVLLKPDYLEAIEALAMMYPDGVTREEAIALWKHALELETRDEWITRAKHYIEQLEQ